MAFFYHNITICKEKNGKNEEKGMSLFLHS